MDWTAGYTSDIEYTAGFYREQSPSLLNFVCVLNGYEPIPLDKPFTYCELGFGRGLTVNVLAASNPQGQFYAADFNPAHVAGARELAASAGLDNLTLLENSFEELAGGKQADLPQFDFITLHGIYTWVTKENQQHIVNFINRYLKPGGVAFLGYNAMPGWAPALPLQRLLVEYGDAFPNRSDAQVKGAADLVGKMAAAGAGYFATNPALEKRLDMLRSGNTNYLVHEYMHKHWQPLFHADVARDLSSAKLDFVGTADLALAFPTLYLKPEQIELIKTMNDSIMQETMKDYFINAGFRKDVFVRGKRKMSVLRQAEWLRKVGAALITPRDAVTVDLKLSIGQVNGKPEIYNPIFNALGQRPHTIAELNALPELANVTLGDLAQSIAFLSVTGQAELYFDGTAVQDPKKSRQLNRAISATARHGDEFHALSSSLLGTGIAATFIERLVFDALPVNGEPNINATSRAVWSMLKTQGRSMMKDGELLKGDDDNMAEVSRQVKVIFDVRLPLWRQLRML